MNTAHWEMTRSEQHDDRVALVQGTRTATFSEVFGDARRLASALVEHGVVPGDRIALMLQNSRELSTALSGALLAGGVVVVLGEVTPAALRKACEHCGPKVAFASRAVFELSGRLAPIQVIKGFDGDPLYLNFDDLVRTCDPIGAPVTRESTDLAQLCYTSGTAGAAKAVEFSHAALDEARAARFEAQPESDVVLLATPPAAFGARFHCVHAASIQRYVFLEKFEPSQILLEIERNRVTEIPMVPTMAKQLLAHLPTRKYDCSSLLSLNVGGSQVSMELANELASLFATRYSASAINVVVNYGTTEAGGGITRTTKSSRLGVGRPWPNVDVRILDKDGKEAPAGGRGEIVVKTPYAGRGYWRDPERSARVFRSGYVHTGDIGYVGSGGELHLVGRQSDVIIQGGFNVDPSEVVAVIEQMPGIAECGVVGIESDLLGEQVVACIVGNSADATEKRIRQHCRANLDSRKLPALVFFFDCLPRTDTGKLKSDELKVAAAARGADMLRHCRASVTSIGDQVLRQKKLYELVVDAIAEVVDAVASDALVETTTTFGDMGIDSVAAVQIAYIISANLGIQVSPISLYTYPTVPSLVAWLDECLTCTENAESRSASA
jgi:long-chain acyl-CoA synthetase